MARFSFLKQDKKGNYRISAFAVCLIIAILAWLLNALSNSYAHKESFRVVYEKIPFDRQPANPLPNSIQITFEGRGFDLLWLNFRKPFKNLKVNMPVNGNDAMPESFAISVAESFLKQYGASSQNLKISFTEPDSIRFLFTEKLTKKVPVKFNVNINYKKRYGSAIGLVPAFDSVSIAGSKEALANISSIHTEEKSLSNLAQSSKIVLKLINPDSANIFLSTQVVDANIDVHEVTEASLSVPVLLPQTNKRLMYVPASVTVTYNITLDNVKKVSATDFLVGTIESDKEGYMVPVIKKQPSFVNVVFINPPLIQALEEK